MCGFAELHRADTGRRVLVHPDAVLVVWEGGTDDGDPREGREAARPLLVLRDGTRTALAESYARAQELLEAAAGAAREAAA